MVFGGLGIAGVVSAVVGIYRIVRGLFVAGGFIMSIFTWFGTIFSSIFAFITGGFALITAMWGIVASYHIIELGRRFVLILFITTVFGWIIDYAMNSVIVYGGKTIVVLFTEFINTIETMGQWGHFALAFLTKIGFFEATGLFLIIMLYTLVTRVALKILFK